MIKIESETLEGAYEDAASSLECSVTQLKIEVVQYPSSGFLGLFKKTAIIVVTRDIETQEPIKQESLTQEESKVEADQIKEPIAKKPKEKVSSFVKPKKKKKQTPKIEITKEEPKKEENYSHTLLNDTIMPQSFVSRQDDEDKEDISTYLADYDDKFDNVESEKSKSTADIAKIVEKEINNLFKSLCFEIDNVNVTLYDENTLLVEFKGKDSALLIGKEGYRYKALSYMIFNWINTRYKLQLRLEIAEFLKNQEDSVARYLSGVRESVQRDGRAQTKVLDGVLIQIALRELRDNYPDKYVAIRSTRDGLKYIIINDYHSN